MDKTTLNRFLSVVALVIWFAVYWYDQGSLLKVLRVLPGFCFPTVLIWFPGPIGNMMGMAGFNGSLTNIDKPTPAWMVATMGWVFLLALVGWSLFSGQ